MAYRFLNKINSPDDIKRLDIRELEILCAEIRKFLVDKVSKKGGHLSSNLGMVEITVALHYCLSSPQDILVFDVGHQCYTHKLLTGRRKDFDNLRSKNGLSGFPSPKECEHDPFYVGHSSTSLSSAIGLARAKKIKNEAGYVVAIIGDGAFTGGMIYEGLNNVEGLDNLIVILNDNKMSISKNSSNVSQYLTKLRTNAQYYKAKNEVKSVLDKTPLLGSGVSKSIQSVKAALRRGIYHSTFFEELGFTYVGPVDGHNLEDLYGVFSSFTLIKKPLFIYIESIKGKGFLPAENNPGAYHGVSSFNLHKLPSTEIQIAGQSFSNIFGQKLVKLAEENKYICGITAAMKYGTGLQHFKKKYPSRFFDVGIAEEHAVTFAGGLAKGGMLPFVCIYSTFLQRAYDQIIHDIVLQNSNVIFAVDRAGLVPCDGETHQGIYDAAYLSQHKDMLIISPSNYSELDYWLDILAKQYTTPRAIRYSRGTEPPNLSSYKCSGNLYDCMKTAKRKNTAVVSYGTILGDILIAIELLQKSGVDKCDNLSIYKMLQINPIDASFIQELMSYKHILFVEEGIRRGGIGEHMLAAMHSYGYKGTFTHLAIDDVKIDHADVDELKENAGLDCIGIAESLKGIL